MTYSVVISEKDRYMALRWAHALESPIDRGYYSEGLREEFRKRAQMIRRIVGATPDEDLSRYERPHPDEIAEAAKGNE